MGQMQIHSFYLNITVYNHMKNIIIFLLFSSIICGCKPLPNPDIIVKGSFEIIPNKKNILLGDTVRFRFEKSNIFETLGGGTFVFNGTLSNNILLLEVDLNSQYFVEPESPNSFTVFSSSGTLKYTTSGRLNQVITSVLNDKYTIDFSIIPRKKGTFIVQLLRGNLYNNQNSVSSMLDFKGNNLHNELIPTGFSRTQNANNQLYAFIVE